MSKHTRYEVTSHVSKTVFCEGCGRPFPYVCSFWASARWPKAAREAVRSAVADGIRDWHMPPQRCPHCRYLQSWMQKHWKRRRGCAIVVLYAIIMFSLAALGDLRFALVGAGAGLLGSGLVFPVLKPNNLWGRRHGSPVLEPRNPWLSPYAQLPEIAQLMVARANRLVDRAHLDQDKVNAASSVLYQAIDVERELGASLPPRLDTPWAKDIKRRHRNLLKQSEGLAQAQVGRGGDLAVDQFVRAVKVLGEAVKRLVDRVLAEGAGRPVDQVSEGRDPGDSAPAYMLSCAELRALGWAVERWRLMRNNDPTNLDRAREILSSILAKLQGSTHQAAEGNGAHATKHAALLQELAERLNGLQASLLRARAGREPSRFWDEADEFVKAVDRLSKTLTHMVD